MSMTLPRKRANEKERRERAREEFIENRQGPVRNEKKAAQDRDEENEEK
jgi:hypothetical protein